MKDELLFDKNISVEMANNDVKQPKINDEW